MKKYILLLLVAFIFSCSKKQGDLIVKTNIKGLKKGTVYLKRVIDTALVTIDSIVINGNSQFELQSELEEADLFYLYLDKNSKEEDRITFFADKGIVEVNTSLKYFVADAEIKGSKQQKVLEEYQKLMTRLRDRSLDLIKESFDAKKSKDSIAFNAIEKKQNSLIKSRYLQTVNFAINNNDSEVAPYIALSEIYDANVNLLDTIHKSLTPQIQASKYGKKLQKYLEEQKLED